MSEKTELSAREVEEAVRAAYTRPDEAATQRESVEEKCALLSVPGLQVEFDPEEAELRRKKRELIVSAIFSCALLYVSMGQMLPWVKKRRWTHHRM